ncbi:MAG: hypothetical protein KKF89_05205 [Nanoarchaeota archaeon]|nr:hypothetical protein [Nanoarchaeota archaeon]MBU1855092.1 hypothetical protein [Nanoarchaeota archaeon]
MKGQIQQVFIYILTIVIVGIILLIGYRSIIGLTEKSCQVERTTFETNLESFILKYTSYGSLHKETMSAPCSYSQICFVDAEAISKKETLINAPKIIGNSVKEGIEQNVFLVKKDFVEPITFMTEIEVENNFFVCINNTNGKFYIKFEGLGKTTAISGVN